MENVDGFLSSALVTMDKIHSHSCAPVSVAIVYVGDSVLKPPPATWIGCRPLGGEHLQVHQWIELSSMMRAAGIQSAQAGPCAAYIGLAGRQDVDESVGGSSAKHGSADIILRWVVREKRVLNPQDDVCAAKTRLVYHGHESKSKREQKKNTSGTQKVVVHVDDEGVGVLKNDDGGGMHGHGRGGKESKCLVFDLVLLTSSLYILGKLWDVENTMIDVEMGYYAQTAWTNAGSCCEARQGIYQVHQDELGCVTEDNTEEVHLVNVIIHVITLQRSIKLEGNARGEEGRNRLRHHRERKPKPGYRTCEFETTLRVLLEVCKTGTLRRRRRHDVSRRQVLAPNGDGNGVQGVWGSGGLDGQRAMKGGLRPGETVKAQSKAMEEDTVKENARQERKMSAKDGCER
ncbi:hypothetical protein F5148DRAFT_1148825 [Russula earlei]|uniref:Uncharacterized protein n=1 Tax=Russula earlei TaxID=71964 RepID=A0ACC0UBX4_9AGAM|nr:hypothetical protein F5148DRAFT_1148825 [Russula earlei]